MEGKDRWEQNGRIFLSPFYPFIAFTLLSISSLAYTSAYIVCIRPTHHPGTPTTQDPVFALNEQYSTGQSYPYG